MASSIGPKHATLPSFLQGVWSSQSNAAGMAAREEEHIGEGGWQQLAGGARLPAQLGMAERQAAPCEDGQRHADGSMQQRRHVGAHPNRQAQMQQWQATVPVYVPQRVAAQADATAACTKCQQWQTSAAAAKSSWQDAEQRCQEFKQHAGDMAQHAKVGAVSSLGMGASVLLWLSFSFGLVAFLSPAPPMCRAGVRSAAGSSAGGWGSGAVAGATAGVLCSELFMLAC